LAAIPAAGEIYVWTDAQGEAHFTTDLSLVPPSLRSAAGEAATVRQRTPAPAPPAARTDSIPLNAPNGRKAVGVRDSGLAAESVKLLRNQMLSSPGSRYGAVPASGVWGLLMETGYPEAASILMVRSDGHVVLYGSNGGGVMGGETLPAVNQAARRLVEVAATQTAKLAPTTSFPWPADGEVRFYALTARGVLSASARRDAIARSGHPLSQLFLAGHAVITELREASEAQQRSAR
jgi:hypothetical protein